jgi:hypothetical protein
MRRKLFTIAAAVPLLLIAAVFALWVRSYFVGETLGWDFSDENPGIRVVGFDSSEGVVGLTYLDYPTALYESGWWHYVYDPWSPEGGAPGWRTFAYERKDESGGRSWRLYFPYWVPIMVFAIPAVFWLAGKRRHQRGVRDRRCPTCGYDLRATPDRCPECGTVV